MDPATAALCDALQQHGCVTPALVIDVERAAANIAAMIRWLGDAARWRPHVKTVKQSRIVALLLDAGVRSFKCATLPELALVLRTATQADIGVDVVLAHPLPPARVPELVALARRFPSARVGLVADAPDALAAWPAEADALALWLDVDLGMHRTGCAPAVWSAWLRSAAAAGRRVVGLQGYEGHLGWDDRAAAHAAYDALCGLAREIDGLQVVLTSGSHGFAHARAHAGLREGPWQHQIGAGTLVLSDLASARPAAALGVVPAAFVAARVIAAPQADRITLDAGSKAITPDRGPPSCAVLGYPGLQPQRASEEHLPLVVSAPPVPPRDAIVLLVPDHVCTTVNLHREAIYVAGARILGTGAIEAAGREPPLPHARVPA
ncbi:MAG: alanine racemase [Nannocystaceae bacterium]|nr:alanine racemase [Nannocystaceae bacterium]